MAISEKRLIANNEKLLIHGDESEVVCEEHNVTKRWGDLSSMAQIAVLAGLDIEGPTCIMEQN